MEDNMERQNTGKAKKKGKIHGALFLIYSKGPHVLNETKASK